MISIFVSGKIDFLSCWLVFYYNNTYYFAVIKNIFE